MEQPQLELEQEQPQETRALEPVQAPLQSIRALLQEPQSHPGSRSGREYWLEPVQEPLSSCIRSKQVLPREINLLQKPMTFHAWN